MKSEFQYVGLFEYIFWYAVAILFIIPFMPILLVFILFNLVKSVIERLFATMI